MENETALGTLPASGGAGWLSNGGATTYNTGGKDWANLFTAGTSISGQTGGYGGGGGGYYSGGGGGGYNGGGGGNVYTNGGGGGGGSYLNGTLSGTATATNTGNGSVTIQYPGLGGVAPYTYAWTPSGGSNLTASNLSAGTYTITVTDANGCTATASTTITALSFSAPVFSTAVTCATGSDGEVQVFPSGGATPYTYSWSTGATTNIVGITKFVSSLSAGTYSVTITDANGCGATNSVVIGKPLPFAAIGKILENAACAGSPDGAAQCIATGGRAPYTYSWNDGFGLYSHGNLSAGTYTCTATDKCGDIATIGVTITQPATALTQTIAFRNVSCNGNSDGIASTVASGGVSPYTYLWLTGSTTTSVTGLSAGAYNVKVTDANTCSITKAFVITQPAVITPVILLQRCVAVNTGTVELNTTGGTRPYTYGWSNGSTNQDLSGLSNGSYTVTVTDNNHCTGTLLVTVSCTSGPDMGDAPKPGTKDCCPVNEISVYPNPNNGRFTVSGVEEGMMIEIYDYSGQRIYFMPQTPKGAFPIGIHSESEIDLSNKSNGIYLIRIINADGTLVSQKKVVKTN